MSLPPKKCFICGAEFVPGNSFQKTCGNANCQRERHSRMTQARSKGQRLCVVCGTAFTPLQWNSSTCNNPECKKHLNRECVKEYNRREKEKKERAAKNIKEEKLTSKELMAKQGIWISGMTFEEKADAARAAGMSYGKWVAKMQMEFEKQQREKQN